MSRAFREDSSAPGSDAFISRILSFLAASKAIKVDSLTVLCSGRGVTCGSLLLLSLRTFPWLQLKGLPFLLTHRPIAHSLFTAPYAFLGHQPLLQLHREVMKANLHLIPTSLLEATETTKRTFSLC